MCLATLFRLYKDLGTLGGVISVEGPVPIDQKNILVPEGKFSIPVLMIAGYKDQIIDV